MAQGTAGFVQWYLSYNGEQLGPLSHSDAVARASTNSNGLCWREGFATWQSIASVSELRTQAAPPPLQQGADQIDYKVQGHEMQFVEIELDPQESVIAEAGALMFKDVSVQMETVFGSSPSGSFVDQLLGAGKRILTGESLFMTVFTNSGSGKAKVAFAAPYPGNIIPIQLEEVGGQLICQKDSFLCAAKGISVGIHFQRKILTGLFGGEGFIMQKIEGNGLAFVHAGGTLVERRLAAGETLHVDTGCVVAYESSVDMDIQQAGGIKSVLFGGEGLFFSVLRGPGRVWLQSLPFSRFAGRMMMAFSHGGKEEGSVLGQLGKIVQGDRGF